MAKRPPAEISFEAEINNLTNLIKQIEGQELSLADSLEAFERGISLIKMLQTHLEDSEQKVTVLASEHPTQGDQDQAKDPLE